MNNDLVKTLIVYGVIILIIFLIVNKIFGFTDKWKADEEAKKRAIDNAAAKGDEQAILIKKGMKLSHPLSRYMDLANRLYAAMKGLGTDDNTVMQVFSQLGNDLDFIELNKSFGIRDEEDLTTWINGEGNSLSTKINKYLRSRNIKYSV